MFTGVVFHAGQHMQAHWKHLAELQSHCWKSLQMQLPDLAIPDSAGGLLTMNRVACSP